MKLKLDDLESKNTQKLNEKQNNQSPFVCYSLFFIFFGANLTFS
uniref:Uncharacterized protein n=1 Tax=Rhizophora mucronata TaxID=61149 RepID=A0A2P2PJ27_RHIMU